MPMAKAAGQTQQWPCRCEHLHVSICMLSCRAQRSVKLGIILHGTLAHGLPATAAFQD